MPAKRSDADRRKRARRAAWITGLLLLAVVVAIAARHGEAERFAAILEHADPRWLLACALLQCATYVCSAAIWRAVLARTSTPQPLALLTRLAVAKVFTDQALPSGGLGGSLLVVRGITRRGADRGGAAAAFVVSVESFYAAFLACIAASIAFAWSRGAFGGPLLALAGAVFAIGLVVTGAMIALARARRVALPSRLRRIGPVRAVVDALASAPGDLVLDRRVLAIATLLQLATIVLDGETLHASLLAVGARVDAPVAVASFVFAMAAEMVGPLPGGLGAFEAASVALLHSFGVPVEEALAGTLVARGFTFWLPMIPGAWIDREELAGESVSEARSGSPARAGGHSR